MNNRTQLPQSIHEAFGDFVNDRLAAIALEVDGTIINVNDNYLMSSGYQRDDLVGRSYYDQLCPPGYRGTPDGQSLRLSWLGGERINGSFNRLGLGGRSFWLEGAYIPIFADNGWPVGTVCIGRDVSERAAECASERIQRQVLESALMSAEYSPAGRILKVNQTYLEAFQYLEEDLIGQNRSLLFSRKKLREPGYRQMWDYICAGHSYSQQVECRDSDGQPIWIEGVYSPVFDIGGKLTKVVMMAFNVTWRVQKERQERELADLLSQVCDKTRSAIMVVDGNNQTLYANDSFSRLFGYRREEIIGRHASIIFGPAEKEVMARIQTTHKNGEPATFEEIAYTRNGQRLWVSCSTTHINEGRQGPCYVAVFTDITDIKMNEMIQKKALEAMSSDRPLTDTLSAICLEVERLIPEVTICVVGLDEQRKLMPLAAPSLAPTCVKVLAGLPVDKRDTPPSLAMCQGETNTVIDLAANPQQNQKVRSVYLSAGFASSWSTPIKSSKGDIFGTVTFNYQERVIPDEFQKRLAQVMARLCAIALEREENRAAIRRLSFFDELTGLPNRGFFITSAERMVKIARQNGQYLAVVLIGLDRMKFFTESLGHKNVDEILRQVAQTFQDRREEATTLIGRVSDDEMAVVLYCCDSARVVTVAEEIQELVARPLRLAGITVTPTASLGICIYPANGEDMDTLLRNAALAMNEARASGHGRFSFYTIEQDQEAKKTLAMEAALRRAIGGPELRLCYQPQISLTTGEINGAEALIRWTSPRFGPVPPHHFISMTQNSGLINRLSEWVLAESCRQLGRWREHGLPVPSLSVNLSSSNFIGEKFLDQIFSELDQNGLTPGDLILELTESVFMEPNSTTLNTIEQAQRAGLRFSVDDFGTGYSCLSYLQRLPIDELKLDRSFVMDFHESEISRCISQAIMNIGHNLGLHLVAEGVETKDQLRLLKQQGWSAVQGFIFSRALAGDEFEKWARAHPSDEIRPFLESLGSVPAASAPEPHSVAAGTDQPEISGGRTASRMYGEKTAEAAPEPAPAPRPPARDKPEEPSPASGV